MPTPPLLVIADAASSAKVPAGGIALTPDDCQACGACCAYSSSWPRFSTEVEADLDLLPAEFVANDLGGMKCDGARCSALTGKVGVATACAVYSIRPDVCRACMPGDAECLLARAAFGLPV